MLLSESLSVGSPRDTRPATPVTKQASEAKMAVNFELENILFEAQTASSPS